MKRDILASISDWEKSRYRKPLILMGARQVGKTWLMTEFASQHYPKDTVYVNFMDDNLLRDQFTSINIDARSVVETISLATGKSIEEGKTLLVLDEIQESPRALTSLKFLCEEMPGLAVMAAGSLLGLSLNRKKKRVKGNQYTNKASFKPVKSYRTSLNEWHPDADPEEVPLYAIASIAKEIEDGNNITFDRL